MLNDIQTKFRNYNKSIFLAYSGINFDSEVMRKEFFKSLKKPYIENTEGNTRHDALNIVRAAFAIDKKIIKSELNSKGNISMKLESLSRLNGFDVTEAHSAMTDTELTVKVPGPVNVASLKSVSTVVKVFPLPDTDAHIKVAETSASDPSGKTCHPSVAST